MVAICAMITEMIFVVRNAATQFERFTHWTLADKLRAPLFRVNGNPLTPAAVSNTLLLLAIVYAVYRFSIEYRKQQGALEQEFRNAMEIQQVLIPETLPKVPGFTVTSAYKPAQQVGGDFFQIIPVEGGSTLVLLGDVSGKGLKAAMAVSLIVGAVRALAEDYPTPGQLLTQLNRRLFGRLQGGFATCLILLLRPDSTCVVASAGHPAPYLNKHEVDVPGALPLGVEQYTPYAECEVTTRPGDHLALYTDGLLEARNRTGELYGFARLNDLFSSPTNAAAATQAAVNFGQDDDITVLTLTRLMAGEEPAAVLLTSALQS
jgi:serine phosphatase RsbU (regulator of sigma subunit)